tara:strand:- start:5806 stop:5934 length:129 start_codon:yes stop_codon:yes gene_type:complete
MIKKIVITFFLFALISSCGKKGDPTYNENDLKSDNVKLKVML